MNNRNDANKADHDKSPKPEQKRPSGGHMGAGRSGEESLGSEKPTDRDNMGSKRPED
jgi:hypothetical protein